MFAAGSKRDKIEASFGTVKVALRDTEMFALGVVCVALIVACVFGWRSEDLVKIVGVTVLVILAMGSVGAFLGFLFAIPRTGPATTAGAASAQPDGAPAQTEPKGEASATATLGMSTNSNLVEVSDWLTKIIVGIGLTQLNDIDTALGNFAAAMEVLFPGRTGIGVYFNCIAVAATLLGFMFFYVQTRTRGVMMFAWMETLQARGLRASDARRFDPAVRRQPV